MKIWRFVPLEIRNGFSNMALDEAILKAVIEKKSPNTLILQMEPFHCKHWEKSKPFY